MFCRVLVCYGVVVPMSRSALQLLSWTNCVTCGLVAFV